ncbi:MAG TPA: ATP-binding cassette domain-containing protein [Fimbriimonadaceae bacterium]|nr:ATP-binding cassette domain-containing protein [Fimbriimonadaceae bacterium]
MIDGLIAPTAGNVFVGTRTGAELRSHQARRSIGYVSQGIALFPFLRVWENISLPLRLRGVPAKERKQRAEKALELVELPPEWSGRMPSELSGGQQQRVAVARALITGTDIILMDEPFGALDALTREALQDEVLRLRDRLGVTVVFVTLDLFEALALADRIVVMHLGEVEQIGDPREVLERPQTEFVRNLFGKPARLLRAAGSA